MVAIVPYSIDLEIQLKSALLVRARQLTLSDTGYSSSDVGYGILQPRPGDATQEHCLGAGPEAHPSPPIQVQN